MPWSGSSPNQTFTRTDGTRTGTTTWQEADGAGVDIIAVDHDTHDQDMASGINAALKKDGGNSPSANLPMGGYKHTNVADASALTHYLTAKQAFANTGNYISTVGGTGNAVTLTTGFSLTAYATGQEFSWKITTQNTTAATVNIDGLGVKSIISMDGDPLEAGDLLLDSIPTIKYDGTQFRLANKPATTSGSGDILGRVTPVGTIMPWPGSTAPAGYLFAYGQAVSRTTYAELFTVYGTAYGSGDGSTTFNVPDYRGRIPFGKDDMGGTAAGRLNVTLTGTKASTGSGVITGLSSTASLVVGMAAFGTGIGTSAVITTIDSSTQVTLSVNSSSTGSVSIRFAIIDGATLGAVGGSQSNTLATTQIPAHSHGVTDPQHSHSMPTNPNVYLNTGGSFYGGSGSFQTYAIPSTLYAATGISINNAGGGQAHANLPPGIVQNWIILALPAAASAAALGVNGMLYKWSTSTSDADPGAGYLGVNHGTISSATELYISETDAAGAGMGPVIALWDDSTSTTRGTLLVYKVGALSTFAVFAVTGSITDGGSYDKATLTHVASGGTFASGDQLAVIYVPKGDKGTDGSNGSNGSNGATGATGAAGATGPNTGLEYAFSTSTSGDPGSGNLLFDSATLASVTQINISETGRSGEALAAVIATWDDSTNTAHYGHLRVFDIADRTKFIEVEVTGTVTDAGSYRTIPVTYTAGGTLPSAAAVLAVMFERTGNKGSDGAGTGDVSAASAFATDNVIIRSDGTAKGVQLSAVAIDDSTGTLYPTVSDSGALGSITKMWGDLFLASGAVVNFNNGDVTITHAANTLTFGGASTGYLFDALAGPTTNDGAPLGSATVSWSDLFLASDAVINFNNGNYTATHSSGLLTLSGALSIGTSNALTAGTIELGHATDTTLSRSAAGVLAVEGVTVALNSVSAAAHVASTIELGHATDTTLARSAAGTMTVEGVQVLLAGQTATISKGFTLTPNSIGTVSSGTTTPDPANGNYQYYTNNGSHTIAAPASDCAIDILMTNGASAVAPTMSGFTVGSSFGSAFTTTNTHKFVISIRRINSVSTYSIYALQ
tara:strand:- start:892 stop:4092 length:3201 start_codon:yes stop_codon:yes gene_type:complete